MPEVEQVPRTEADTPSKSQKAKPGASWKADEEHVLPKNKMVFVFTGLMLCVFLAALDQASHTNPS
jgi:hypothetical protein